MHFTVLSLFKLFACSKSFNVLLLTNMEKKVQRVQTMIYTSAVVFVPYLDVEKRFLQHSIMAQSCMFGSTTMGQQDYFCSKNLWPATFFELFISFMPNLQPQLFSYIHTIWLLEKNASLKNCVFGTNAIKKFWLRQKFLNKVLYFGQVLPPRQHCAGKVDFSLFAPPLQTYVQ